MREKEPIQVPNTLNEWERAVLSVIEVMSDAKNGITASNKDVAEFLDVSRKAVSNARKSIGRKLGRKGGW